MVTLSRADFDRLREIARIALDALEAINAGAAVGITVSPERAARMDGAIALARYDLVEIEQRIGQRHGESVH